MQSSLLFKEKTKEKKKKKKIIGPHEMPVVNRLLEKITPLYLDECCTPVSEKVSVFLDLGKKGMHVSMGNFYEGVTRALYGGVVLDAKFANCCNNGTSPTLFDLEDLVNWDNLPADTLVKPDGLILNEAWWESKSWRIDHACHLLDGQLERYEKIQKRYPNYDIFFAFYGHNFWGIKDTNINELTLFSYLCEGTKYSLRVPLSIIQTLHSAPISGGNDKFSYRYKGGRKKYQPCTMAKVGFIRGMLEDPSEVIDALGLDPEDYTIERYMSPPNLVINPDQKGVSLQMKQFPIVIVKHKDHAGWLERSMYKKNIPEEDDGLPF